MCSYKHKNFRKHGIGLNPVPVETNGNFRQLQLKLLKKLVVSEISSKKIDSPDSKKDMLEWRANFNVRF